MTLRTAGDRPGGGTDPWYAATGRVFPRRPALTAAAAWGNGFPARGFTARRLLSRRQNPTTRGGKAMATKLAEHITALKQDAFLRRIAQVTGGDSERWVPIGILGQEMGLPYEEALAITDHLRESGWIRRGGGGRLEAPDGPRVRVLPEGLEYLRTVGDGNTSVSA